MILRKLLTDLHDPDPAIRIQTLRVLALVEETRALNDILDLYKTDPDPQVRQVAQWSGSRLWQAQKAGHNTEAAITTHFKTRKTQTGIDQLIDSLAVKAKDEDYKTQAYIDHVKNEWERMDAIKGSTKKTDDQVMQQLTKTEGLLESGLSEDFRALIRADLV